MILDIICENIEKINILKSEKYHLLIETRKWYYQQKLNIYTNKHFFYFIEPGKETDAHCTDKYACLLKDAESIKHQAILNYITSYKTGNGIVKDGFYKKVEIYLSDKNHIISQKNKKISTLSSTTNTSYSFMPAILGAAGIIVHSTAHGRTCGFVLGLFGVSSIAIFGEEEKQPEVYNGCCCQMNVKLKQLKADKAIIAKPFLNK